MFNGKLSATHHKTCTFKMCWNSYISDVLLVQGCRDAEKNVKSLPPFVTSYIACSFHSALQLELFHERFNSSPPVLPGIAAATGHLGGICWKINILPYLGNQWFIVFVISAIMFDICALQWIIMPQLYIYKRSTAFENGYLKSLLSANCKKS